MVSLARFWFIAISAFAEKAAYAFSHCGSEDALEWGLQNWHLLARQYFDAFIEDVRKTEVPLSTDCISVDGICMDVSNPIFTFLSPKIIHPLTPWPELRQKSAKYPVRNLV